MPKIQTALPAETIETYLSQFAAKLKPNGLGFIHHSNLGEFATSLFTRRTRTPGGNRKGSPRIISAIRR